MAKPLRDYDIAYGCFLAAGIVPLIISLASSVAAIDDMGKAGYYFFGALSIGALAAMFTGIRFALPLREHVPLTVLSVLTLVYLVEVFARLGPAWFYDLTPLIYGIVVVLTSSFWFLFLRARYKA